MIVPISAVHSATSAVQAVHGSMGGMGGIGSAQAQGGLPGIPTGGASSVPYHANAPLPAHLEAFYTEGVDPSSAASATTQITAPSPMESSNLVSDMAHYLEGAGPSSPSTLLGAQTALIEGSLGWMMAGQLAGKAVSGVQTLFNNQV